MMIDVQAAQPAPRSPYCSGLSRHRHSRGEPRAVDETLHREIATLIPRLQRYARQLTRDPVAADDLVQDCLARALGKINIWEPGTDLRAWLFAILHNQHISLTRRDMRHRAHCESLHSEPSLTLAPTQPPRLELRDLERALARLPEEQRSVILLIGLGGMGYEEAASVVNLPVGTVRSRVSRGREALRMMTGLFPTRHCRDARAGTAPARNRRKPFILNREPTSRSLEVVQ